MTMRKSYDFSRGVKNPYIKLLKRQITIRLEHDVIAYFKKLAAEKGIPYQILIKPLKNKKAVTPPPNEWQVDHDVFSAGKPVLRFGCDLPQSRRE